MTPAVPDDLARHWTHVESELRRSVSDDTYDLWLGALRPRALHGDTLVVGAPAQIRAWVSERFAGVLREAAVAALGPHADVRVTAHDEPLDEPGSTPTAPAHHGRWRRDGTDPDAFNPKLTFDQFVIGDTNRFAHAAALTVAEMPGQAYNPLFLYGPPGVGKTHLLHSIGNYLTAYGGGLGVRYATAEAFTSAFVDAVRGGDVDAFKARFRHTDVLLLDDVQFLQSKARTEEEFFHTFNALYDAGAQLVLTCDRLPSDLGALEDRLLERFRSGLVADLAPPDRAARRAILRKRVAHDGIVLADHGALDVVAERITGDARTLEGALIRVVAFHSLTGRPLDAALAEEVLAQLYPTPQGPSAVCGPTIERVQELCCAAFGIDRGLLLSGARGARLTWARQVAMYLAREHTGESLPAIGRGFGDRSHTTVLHACRRTAARLSSSPDDQALVHSLERRLRDRT